MPSLLRMVHIVSNLSLKIRIILKKIACWRARVRDRAQSLPYPQAQVELIRRSINISATEIRNNPYGKLAFIGFRRHFTHKVLVVALLAVERNYSC